MPFTHEHSSDEFRHDLFGVVSGLQAQQARRHDEVLGNPKQVISDVGEATKCADVMSRFLDKVVAEAGKVLKGELVAKVVRAVAEAILTKSHVLLEGASGTGKTVAVKLVAKILDLPYERIDALPDLSDLDIIGGEIYENNTLSLRRSRLLRPIVLMLIDEFGRLSATCANAFLQALEEREVNVSGPSGFRLELSPGFVVAAAMNPQNYGGGGGINEALFDRISVGMRMPMPNNRGMSDALSNARIMVGNESDEEVSPQKLPLPYTLRQIWSAVNLVKVPEEYRQAIINANYVVSPPAYREANGWTECDFTPHDRAEAKTLAGLEEETTKYLFEGSNPRGMYLTTIRARANAFFRGDMTVNTEDLRRAAQAALLFRLKSYPGTSPAVISGLIQRAVDLTIPRMAGA